MTGVRSEGKLVQEEGRRRPRVVRGRNAGPGLMILSILRTGGRDVVYVVSLTLTSPEACTMMVAKQTQVL